MMKKALFVFVVSVLTLMIAACSLGAGPDDSSGGVDDPLQTAVSAAVEFTDQASRDQDSGLAAHRMLIGTLMLEDTDQAVEPETAAELLPLWQAYRALVSSDTASQVEVTAVLSQIEETMGEERLAAITDMDLDSQNLGELMQDLGLEFALPQGEPGEGASPGDGPGGTGRVPGGGRGGGGAFGGGEAEFDPAAIATAQAERGFEGGTRDPGSTMLLDPVLELLQERAER